MKNIAIFLLSITLFHPVFIHAKDCHDSLNISGLKTFSSVYTDIKGNTPSFSNGLRIDQSTRLLLERNTKNGLNMYMNYDDTREANPLEMLVNYQKGILSASLGHLDIVLDETEFSAYNHRMFGVKAETINTDRFYAQAFGAINRGTPRIATYQGDIGHDSQYVYIDEFVKGKYYLLLPERVIDVLLDDGILENGTGFERLTPYTDYNIMEQRGQTWEGQTQTVGANLCVHPELSGQTQEGQTQRSAPTIVLTVPAGINAAIQVVYEQSGTVATAAADNYYKLNYPDVVTGSEVVTSGSSTLIRGIDYQINYADAVIYFAARTNFSINYSYAAKTYQLDPPVFPGSERVTVDEIKKQRGVDYTINYETGEVRFFDQHMSGIYADSVVRIEYETTSEGNRYNLTGLRGGYSLNGWMDVGCSCLLQSDAAPKAKTTQAMTQMRQQIIGLDASIHPGEGLKITGELAAGRKEPGNYGKVYIDDMEGDDLLSRWKALSPGVNIASEKNPAHVSHPDEEDNHQSLRIMCGQGTNTIEQIPPVPLDLSLYSSLSGWIKAQATSVTAALCLYSASNNYFSYDITPDKTGEYILVKPQNAVIHGEPDLKAINRIQLIFNNIGSETATLYIDDLIADNGLAQDGLAKKLEAEFSNEHLLLKAGVRDIDYGFNPMWTVDNESISDTRSYQAEAQIPLMQATTLFLKYEDKLKPKSSLKQGMFSTGIRIEPSDVFKLNIDYKQENENDSKAVHTIDSINKKTIMRLDVNKLPRFQFFSRLMNINACDTIHNLRTSSNHTHLRFNLKPAGGIEIIPEYKLKRTEDLNRQSRTLEEENISNAINITPRKHFSTILRYSTDKILNHTLDSQQYNQTLSMESAFNPKGLPSLNTSLENIQIRYLEQQRTTYQTDVSSGNIKAAFSSPEQWKWLLQYRFSRNLCNGVKNKTDNYIGEITRWFKVAKTSSIASRICRNTTNLSVVDTYTAFWETTFRKGLSTRFGYERYEKNTPFYGGLTRNTPSIKIGYAAEKWNVSSEVKQTKSLNRVSNLKATDRFWAMSSGYKVKGRLSASQRLSCSDNESNHKTTYSSSMELNWKTNKMLNTAVKSIWSNVHDRVNPRYDYNSHQVKVDVSIVF